MKFYTSVLPYRGRLLVRGVNHDGSHKKYRINYKPSLFIPSGKESKYKTLDNRNVGKVTFESMPEARKWIEQYKDVDVNLGISASYLNLLESGRRPITVPLLIKIGNELGISLKDLTLESNLLFYKVLKNIIITSNRKIIRNFTNQHLNPNLTDVDFAYAAKNFETNTRSAIEICRTKKS